MKHVDTLMQEALAEKVFPGSVLLVAIEDRILFHQAYGLANLFTRQEMTQETVFDLASLTKPLATTLAIMALMNEKRIPLSQRLSELLPQFKKTDKAEITLAQLLSHTSGYPDYQPYFQKLNRLAPEKRSSALKNLLIHEPLANPVGHRTVYSDLGFMVLRWVIETVSAKRLDRFVKEKIYFPRGINDLFFIDLCVPPPAGYHFAATEKCPWRKIMIQGAVHDDNAFVMGGIDGHAGLFGTAQAVYRLLTMLYSAWRGKGVSGSFDSALLNRFFSRQNNAGRALGFDMPSRTGSSSGGYFSEKTVGHLGFTGTSFWMDLERSILVIFLTNRVHPTRANEKIKAFRPILHDAIMQPLVRRPG